MEWPSALTALGILGGSVTVINALSQALKARAESRIAAKAADATATEITLRLDASLREEADYERKLRRAETARVNELEGELERLKLQAEDHLAEEERRPRLQGLAILADRLRDGRRMATGLSWLLDRAQCCMVITASEDRGVFVWVSRRWLEVLGYPDDSAILGSAWRQLLHPADLPATQTAEASAFRGRIDGTLVNRFRCHDGRYALMRWYADTYTDGVTLALARHEGYENDQRPDPAIKVEAVAEAE